jgi:hypothetical protein
MVQMVEYLSRKIIIATIIGDESLKKIKLLLSYIYTYYI